MTRVLPLFALVFVFAGGAGAMTRTGAPLVAHPRLILDPTTLSALRQRAQSNTPEWQALKDRCDYYLTGHVEWPDGDDYPSDGSIGEGYQGDGYFPALLNVALCYQTELGIDAAKAAKYGAKGADVLYHMSEPPPSSHAPNPLRDSGYGIRFYGQGMAIGYDWLYPALGSSLRTRVYTALNRWIAAFESGAFERDFPQGNYFAGYYAAKAAAALATEGDNPSAPAQWTDWLDRVHRQLVRPYYAANLSGGGWPEGWNYGPLGTINMSLPALEAQTAKGIDLLHDPAGAYSYPLNAPRYSLYFTWPNLLTMDDSDAVYDSDNPTPTHPWLVTEQAGLLERASSPFAPTFHTFARAIRTAQPGGELGADWDLWENFLFWNDSAAERSYTAAPLSYFARGLDDVAMRSSWKPDAVWAAFKGGPYVNYPDNGEEFFDKGSLAIVRGGRPLLVNATGALLRNTPGTTDGSDLYNPVYDENFGDTGQRSFYNVFYVNKPSVWGQGNVLRRDGARTHVAYAQEGRSYLATRAVHLEDEYPRNSSDPHTMTSWTRDVVYLRPELFVVDDRTAVTSSSIGQWTAFALARKPIAAAAPAAGVSRYDVGSGSEYAGTVETVLPAGHTQRIVDLFNAHKVYRYDVRPGTAAVSNRWLTVFDAAASPSAAALASPLSPAGMRGVLLTTAARDYVVLAGAGAAGTPVTGEVQYTIPKATTLHVLTDLQPKTAYTVTVSDGGSAQIVTLKPGAGPAASANGVLSFQSTP